MTATVRSVPSKISPHGVIDGIKLESNGVQFARRGGKSGNSTGQVQARANASGLGQEFSSFHGNAPLRVIVRQPFIHRARRKCLVRHDAKSIYSQRRHFRQ
jgi:hypothetical protein